MITSTRNTSARANCRGFTLIEVSLAVAVCAIGLIAILSLFPHALQSARDAGDNTLVATMVEKLFNGLRTNAYSTVAALPNSTLYFDQAGFPTNSVAGAYYQVDLRYQPQTPLPQVTRITATVLWPAAAAIPFNTNMFVTQITQYDRP
jgi:uncharacterized protein (TIGR02598 family)